MVLTDRQVTRLTKGVVALLVVVVAASGAASLRTSGLDALTTFIPSLYVVSVVFLGVWDNSLTTRPYGWALLFGFLAVAGTYWEPTTAVAPLFVVPGIAVIARDHFRS